MKSGGVNPRKLEDPNAKKLEKEKKLKEQKELALIFKPVQMQKIDKGTIWTDIIINSYCYRSIELATK